jgi:hypothetical protein
VGRREKLRRTARQKPFLEPKRRLLVVCEGAVTEVEYLENFRKWTRNPRLAVEVVGPGGVPRTLVERAQALKAEAERSAEREGDESLRYEEVWCVFDVDEHPSVLDARSFASSHGLRLAMSNPCFELWLLLHFRSSPGMQTRHKVQEMLSELMPKTRAKHIDFDRLIAGYDSAFQLATRIEREALAHDEPLRNPLTEMFRLTDSIDEGGSQRREKPVSSSELSSRAKAEAAAAAARAQAADEHSRMVDDDLE